MQVQLERVQAQVISRQHVDIQSASEVEPANKQQHTQEQAVASHPILMHAKYNTAKTLHFAWVPSSQ